jgi:hypothetical protein
MFCRDKYCFTRNAVHVYTCTGLEVLEVDKTILGHEEDIPCFFDTCMAKSLVASGGKYTSTFFFVKGGSGAW